MGEVGLENVGHDGLQLSPWSALEMSKKGVHVAVLGVLVFEVGAGEVEVEDLGHQLGFRDLPDSVVVDQQPTSLKKDIFSYRKIIVEKEIKSEKDGKKCFLKLFFTKLF